MKNVDKNRDPDRARKRAVADARCALRKLELLTMLACYRDEKAESKAAIFDEIVVTLNVGESDQ